MDELSNEMVPRDDSAGQGRRDPLHVRKPDTFSAISTASAILAAIVSIIFAGCFIIPFSPLVASTSNDTVWPVVLGDGFARHAEFGRDLVFTYGPWGFVETRYYDPRTFLLLLSATALLYFGAVAILFSITRTIFNPRYRLLYLAIVVLAMAHATEVMSDSFFFLFPWLLLISRIAPTVSPSSQIVAAACCALVSLGKFSCFPATVIVVIAVTALDLLARRFPFAFLTFVSTTTILWLAAHQRLGGFLLFLRNSLEVASGYSEAMNFSSGTERSELIPFLLVAFLLVFFLATRTLRGFITATATASLLFFLFKAAFVRGDAHVLIGSATVFLFFMTAAPVFVEQQSARRRVLITLGFATGLSGYLFAFLHYSFTGPIQQSLDMMGRFPSQLRSAGNSVLDGGSALRSEYERGHAQIRKETPLPPIEGTCDIYPGHQTVVLAHHLRYAPRPIFESYSAYTPRLLEINAAHLRGSDAPDTLLFDVETKDERLPSLDDAASWPELFSRYSLSGTTNRFLILQHRKAPLPMSRSTVATFSTRFDVPNHVPQKGLLWCQIDLNPSLSGKLRTFLFRGSIVRIYMEMDDGSNRHFRLVPGNARSGFLISPLVESREDFGALLNGGGGRRPRRITLECDDPGAWEPDIHIVFELIQMGSGTQQPGLPTAMGAAPVH